MADYRRVFVAGGTYFFTVNLADRGSRRLTDHIDRLRTAFRYARERHPFALGAIVVLPDHLHAIWTLPEGDADFPLRWRLVKTVFSAGVSRSEAVSRSRAGKGERGIWQRRYWEHAVRDQTDFNRHVDYIHYNPVKHGHAARIKDWPYSSYHRMVRLGRYPEDWSGEEAGISGDFGER
jgi:putative transposase